MPAWGVKGGGPLNDQQLQNLIDYLEIDPAHARRSRRSRSTEKLAEMRKEKKPQDGTLDVPDVGHRRARRCSTSATTTASPAAPTPAAAATPPAGPTTRRRPTATAPSARRCAAASALARFPGRRSSAQTSRSTSSAPAPSRASSTAATARAPAACRASARCRPRSTTRSSTGEVGVEPDGALRPRHGRRHATKERGRADRRATSGASDHVDLDPRRHHLGPGLPRHPLVVGRRPRPVGSVYLMLATNTGCRLGFLLALTGLIGWMMIMGLVWTMYGIGYQGPAAVLEGRGGQLRRPHRRPRPRSRATLPGPGRSCPTAEELLRGRPRAGRAVPDDRAASSARSLGDLLGVDPELEERPAEDDLPDERLDPARVVRPADR